MASMKVLVILFGAMLVLIEFQKASAATLLEDFDDDDDLLDDGGDFDLEANSDASSGNGNDSNDAVPEKRRACADLRGKTFCRLFKSYCDKKGIRGRLMRDKCSYSCGCRG
ncbi:hypothetical protein pdam_00023321 [Pocillopora damicornis]|uniref:uncharacterized protein LOC113670121 n=1 Tax=Pocillopora damicornis TaxID=46731 RepID=UPI000F3C72C1|nr:uncharacterized protein LOC113670121 [Pocillopora damicornis]RMX47400.1 hypothetical protein pdam_00023321 [Pocillopora damicornis]